MRAPGSGGAVLELPRCAFAHVIDELTNVERLRQDAKQPFRPFGLGRDLMMPRVDGLFESIASAIDLELLAAQNALDHDANGLIVVDDEDSFCF
jgi:hypothetical protein